jgi:hypothetical protein
MRQRCVDSPRRITVVVSKMRGSDAGSRGRACQVRPRRVRTSWRDDQFRLGGWDQRSYVLVGREGEVKGPGIWLVPRSVGGSPWVNGL